MKDPKETHAERGKEYGDYGHMAHVAEAMFGCMPQIEDVVLRNAAHMICVKLARMSCGNGHNVDNWHDIAGYARLAESHSESYGEELG